MNIQVLHECLTLALEGKISFPEAVRRMIEIGVERYRVDLTLLQNTYYSLQHETYEEKIPLRDAPAVSSNFSLEAVRGSIREAQQGKIDYPEFLRRVMQAGCCFYEVFIAGEKVIYFGQRGEFHVEEFPKK